MKVELPKELRKKLKKTGPRILNANADFLFGTAIRRWRKARSAKQLLNDATQTLSQSDRDLLQRFYVENLSSSWGLFLAFPLGVALGSRFGWFVGSEHGPYWTAALIVVSLVIASVGFHVLIKALVASYLNQRQVAAQKTMES